MTPLQIDQVTSSWRAVCQRRVELRDGIAAMFAAAEIRGPMSPVQRAEWIVQTVDRLCPLLTRPRRLAVAAVDMALRRGDVTSADLQLDRDALLAGISAAVDAFDSSVAAAWQRACELFLEAIADLVLNPFSGG